MLEIDTGIPGLDRLPGVVGGINGAVSVAECHDVALYLAMAAGLEAGVVVSLARDTFAESTPIAANQAFLAAHGYTDVEGWADAVAEGNGAVHPDDLHTLETHIQTRCCGDFKTRLKIDGGPPYVRSHVQLIHIGTGGDTFRVMLVVGEV